MNLQELLDREEIRELQVAYNIAADRGQIDQLLDLFTPDAVIRTRNGTAVGRDAIIRQLSQRVGPTPADGPNRRMVFSRHNLTTSQVAFESSSVARGRTYYIAFSEIGPDHMGVYVDRYRKVGGTWLISERTSRVDWVAESGHSVKSRPTPATSLPSPSEDARG